MEARNKILNKLSLRYFTAIVSSATVLILTGCPGGDSGGDLSVGNAPSPGSSTFAITADTVYPSVIGTSWVPVTSGSAYYFKGAYANVSIAGTCTRGIETIKAYVNGSTTAVSETASCAGDHTYVLQHAFGAAVATTGDAQSVVLKGYSALGEELASATAPAIVIDTIAPTAASFNDLTTAPSSFTNLGSNSYSSTGTSVTITGTWDGIEARSLSPVEIGGSGTLTATNCGTHSCTFSYSVTLTEGTPLLLTLIATDVAGNTQNSTTITVNYLASSTFIAWDLQGGASIEASPWTMFSAYSPADSTTRLVMQASVISLGASTPAASVGGAADTAYIYLGIPNLTSMNP